MISKYRVEADASSLQELLLDLDGAKRLLEATGMVIEQEHYERVSENGSPHFKGRLVFKEQTDG